MSTTETTSTPGDEQLVEEVRARYAAAALGVQATGEPATDCGCAAGECTCAGGCCSSVEAGKGFGERLYDETERAGLPAEAVLASLGCGNPTAVADLHPGETVLDLGSGGGIDVLLSARRVGPTGKVYGLDMTEEMLQLARRNAAKAGGHQRGVPPRTDRGHSAARRDGRRGDLELRGQPVRRQARGPGRDRPRAAARRPDRDQRRRRRRPPRPADRAARGSHVGCIAGALSFSEYQEGLTAAGLTGTTITATHQVTDGMHGAIIKATKPTPTGCC